MPSLLPPDTITLDYRPDLDVLVIRWLRDVPEAADVQALYAAVLSAARAHAPASRWLLDVRRRPYPDPEVARWFAQEWLPAASAQLAPRRLHLAYLLSPLRYEAIFDNPALELANARIMALDQPYLVQTFLDEGAALEWLGQAAAD